MRGEKSEPKFCCVSTKEETCCCILRNRTTYLVETAILDMTVFGSPPYMRNFVKQCEGKTSCLSGYITHKGVSLLKIG